MKKRHSNFSQGLGGPKKIKKPLWFADEQPEPVTTKKVLLEVQALLAAIVSQSAVYSEGLCNSANRLLEDIYRMK